MTTTLAVYAALVSTSAIAWQIVSWRLARRTSLTVGITGYRREGSDDAAGRVAVDNLLVTVTNFSEHPVRVASAKLTTELTRRDEQLLFFSDALSPDDSGIARVFDLSKDLARVIEARDSARALVKAESLENAGLSKALWLKAYVRTATGSVFSSLPHPFRAFDEFEARQSAPGAS